MLRTLCISNLVMYFQLISAVDAIQYRASSTNTADALATVHNHAFRPINGGRSGKAKIGQCFLFRRTLYNG